MSSSNLMRQSLPETALPSGANFLGDGAASVGNQQALAVAREWFAAAVKNTKQDAYAAAIGVDSGVLSQMLSGNRQRHIYLVHALPLLEAFATAQPFIGWACRRARMVEPTPLDTITLSSSEARLLAWMRRTSIWTLFLGELIAREFYRVELDLLDAAVSASAK